MVRSEWADAPRRSGTYEVLHESVPFPSDSSYVTLQVVLEIVTGMKEHLAIPVTALN